MTIAKTDVEYYGREVARCGRFWATQYKSRGEMFCRVWCERDHLLNSPRLVGVAHNAEAARVMVEEMAKGE